jgi:deazaflavin-dependent oxidoreductase (nitroreductase family)
MHEAIQRALENERTIDITTIGRKTGLPRRIEIWFHYIDDTVYITGLPGKRSWYANMKVNPDFTFHLKQSVMVDIPATAHLVTDNAERRRVLAKIVQGIDSDRKLEEWVAGSPLVEVELHLDEVQP